MNTPPLLLIPGLLNDARLWKQQLADLAHTTSSTVVDITGANSVSELANAALEQAPAGQFALAGLSMGGYVALEIMRKAPERVLALALLDTSARPDTPEATAGRHKLMQLAETNFQSVIDTLLPKFVHPAHMNNASLVAVIDAMAKTVGKEAFLRQQQAILSRVDSRPSLAQIKCPTLVLCGREDAITPVEIHEEIAAAISGSHLVVIEECGHLSPLDQPSKVTGALRKWLSTATL